MSAGALTAANGLKLRMQQIATPGHNTNAGAQVYLGKTVFVWADDVFPAISIGVPVLSPERIVTHTQTYTFNASFSLVGFIKVPTEDYSSNPLALQADMIRAALRPAPEDILEGFLEDLNFVRSSIEYAQDMQEFTRVSVELRARWTETIGVTQP